MALRTISPRVTPVLNAKTWKYLYTSGSYTLALDQSSYAWGWGFNIQGQLGDNTTANKSSPVSVFGGRQWTSIINCNVFSFGLDNLSYAYVWGNGASGALGQANNLTNQLSPISLPGGKQWLSATLSDSASTVAIDNLSYAWCWGLGSSGQIGNNGSVDVSSPVSVVGDKQWLSALASGQAVIALDNLSYAWGWGNNFQGGLGNNSTTNAQSPVSVVGGLQFKRIFTKGGTWTIALDANSYAWGWGNNFSGALGNNTTANQSSPVSVLGGKQWRQISLNSTGFVIALDSLSYAWAWGSGTNGELGNNGATSQSSPISVVGGKQWLYLYSSTGFTVAIDNLSYAYAWGQGTTGQLGNNLAVAQSSPVSVVGGKQWATANYSYPGTVTSTAVDLLDASNFAWSWGAGTAGQLGNNLTVNQSSPVSIVIPPVFISGLANPFGL
jgi:alpha-tubulin suppressor-like RCC1 family protein